MLTSVFVKNLILIDNLEINFEDGFTAFTGETGAGKSIIFDCLMFSLGVRLNARALKNKNEKGVVCSQFDVQNLSSLQKLLDEKGFGCPDNILTLRRELNIDGKNKIYINDIPSTVTQLLEIKEFLLEVCGQHDNKGLLDSSNHIKLLDRYSKLDKKLSELHTVYKDWRQAKKDLIELKQRLDKSDIEKNYLQNIIEDVEGLNLQDSEEDTLLEQRKFLQSAARLKDTYQSSKRAINTVVLPELYGIQKFLLKDEEFFREPMQLADGATIDIEELVNSLEALAENFGNEDEDLEKIEGRLFAIKSTARKYLINSNMLVDFLADKKQELYEIENAQDQIEKATQKTEEFKSTYLNKAKGVSKTRSLNIGPLCDSINANFKELKLENASFKIDVVRVIEEEHFSQNGIDKIIFLIKTNAGGQFDRISKVASGGELSRFLLAVKVATIGVKNTNTIIFDEIDTGVSGATSHAIGKKLSSLSKASQVIVITHQPQVAAFSNNHFVVKKIANDDSTSVKISKLTNVFKQQEIARLLSGEALSQESLDAAQKLMDDAI